MLRTSLLTRLTLWRMRCGRTGREVTCDACFVDDAIELKARWDADGGPEQAVVIRDGDVLSQVRLRADAWRRVLEERGFVDVG